MFINIFKNSEIYKKIYNNSKYLYKIDLYIIKKKMIKKGKIEEKYKNKNITDKKVALKFLNKQKSSENLYYAYAYSLDNKLRVDRDIYEMLKEKFIFNEDEFFRNFARSFVHKYGESCGEGHNKEKINECLSEIKKFITSQNPLYAYWMFYSLDCKCDIPFNDYYEIYNLFKEEDTIQGYLIGEFTHRGKRPRKSLEYIKLLEHTSYECLKDNYFMILTRWYYDKDLYNYLLKRGIEKEKLDEQVNEYLERYETLKEKAQNNNLTSDEKKDYQKYIALYYRVIQEDYDVNDPVYNYFKDKKEMNYIKDDQLICSRKNNLEQKSPSLRKDVKYMLETDYEPKVPENSIILNQVEQQLKRGKSSGIVALDIKVLREQKNNFINYSCGLAGIRVDYTGKIIYAHDLESIMWTDLNNNINELVIGLNIEQFKELYVKNCKDKNSIPSFNEKIISHYNDTNNEGKVKKLTKKNNE